jgi:hypothetical protein
MTYTASAGNWWFLSYTLKTAIVQVSLWSSIKTLMMSMRTYAASVGTLVVSFLYPQDCHSTGFLMELYQNVYDVYNDLQGLCWHAGGFFLLTLKIAIVHLSL